MAEREQSTPYDHPVRRAARERAAQKLADRVGLSDRLTATQREELHQYDGPELIGSRDLLPGRDRR